MRLFDACCYVGRWPTEELTFHTAKGLLAEMDRFGIERALVSHTLAWQDAPAFGNERLMEEIAPHPRLEPCWVVLPGETLGGPPGRDAAALCDRLAAEGVRAVRIYPRDHVYPLADWMVGDLLGALADRRYVLLIDQEQVILPTGLFDVDPAGWTHIRWLCGAFPGLSVVLTKVGYRALRVLLLLMQDCPNLHLDLSYFSSHLGIEEIVARCGAERLLFGTNQPLTDPGGVVTRLAYAGVTAQQQEQIAAGNLERLLDRVEAPKPSPMGRGPGSIDANGAAVIGRARTPASSVDAQPEAATELSCLAQAGISLAHSGMEIIDAHIHLGPYRNFYTPDPSAASIVRIMDRCGIAKALMASTMAIGPDWITGNRLTAEAVAAYPDRFMGYAVANPNEPSLIRGELTRAFGELGFVAVKLHPDLHAHPVSGPGYAPAWQFAAERGCLLLSHTFHGSRFCDPCMFGQLAERYPDVPILLAHSGSVTAAFEGAIALAKKYPNVYLDLSGSYSTGQWIARMVTEAGADRVIWSSDIPFIDVHYSLGRAIFAPLTSREQAMVLGGNIRRLLGRCIEQPAANR
jgi:predicted TIM-barrel fold metal-dependent hydrolase